MADDNFPQRPQRASQPPVRGAPSSAPQSGSGNDPLAELARLIGRTDPFGEYGRDGEQQAAESAPAMTPQFAGQEIAETAYPAEAYAQGPMPGHGPEAGDGEFDQGPYFPNIPHDDAEEEHFYDDVPPRRRMGILAIAAVFSLAVIGVAGAFGYRALFGDSTPSGPPPVIKADTTPSKVVPAKNKNKDAKSGKLIYDRLANGQQDEKLVSREEQPVDIGKDGPTGATFPPSPTGSTFPPGPGGASSGTIQQQQPSMGNGVVGVEPKKIHTIAIHPDQAANDAPEPLPAAAAPAPKPAPTEAQPPPPAAPKPTPKIAAPAAQPAPQRVVRAEPTARHAPPPRNAPLSLNPNAPVPAPAPVRPPQRPRAAAAPTQLTPARTTATAPITPAASSGAHGYAVQVASRRNEADAQASLRSLQAKYPQQLGGHSPLIRRVDLGAKGIYYRAMIGPFSSAEEASRVCSSLKAAGGDCLVHKI